MKTFDVAIAGDVFCDLIFTGLPGMPEQGAEIYSTDFDMVPGGTYITAVTLRRLGMDVGLFCHLGTDPFSRFVLESMEAEGLDLSLVQRLDYPVKTITVALSFSEDRAFVSYADPRPAEPSPAEALSRFKFRHLHIHWLGQLWEQPGLVELAREQGASVSLDCQCCPETMARPDVFEKLRLVDVFMPNRPEALQVARATDPEEALLAIAAHAPTAIVKLGENGSIAMREGKRYAFPAMRVPVVDTTGAGDAFAGGFIYGMLSGMSFEESMRTATICGALSTTARGGGTRVPRLPELQDLMRKEW